MTDTRTPGYGKVDREYAMRLATTAPEDDGPIWMVNLMSYRERAIYQSDEHDGGSAISGREADDRYAPLDILADIGAEVVFAGDVQDQLLGESPRWHRVGVVKYPTRRSFIEMQSRPDFLERHVHKEAGMAQTIVSGCTPIPSPANAPHAPAVVDWADVPHPPTDDDGPAMVLHFIRFHPGKADTDMVDYQNHAAEVAVRHGVRISGWFGVEGTIVGDGRSWDQARFNLFPSKAAFMEVVFDPARLEAQANHREVAIADTYTLIIRPTINRIEESVTGT
jgi:hypothetical protein